MYLAFLKWTLLNPYVVTFNRIVYSGRLGVAGRARVQV